MAAVHLHGTGRDVVSRGVSCVEHLDDETLSLSCTTVAYAPLYVMFISSLSFASSFSWAISRSLGR